MSQQQTVPTKGNLIATKRSLDLAKLGFDLLDRKRNILIREMMQLISTVGELEGEISSTYREAYLALQQANISLGVCGDIAETIPIDDGLSISHRSVMGVNIPIVSIKLKPPKIYYGFDSTNSLLDTAYLKFERVKQLTTRLAEIESSVYRLADSVKKTQKRANALQNIMIPRFTETVKFMTLALEEKEREEFSRLKVIKSQKNNKTARQ